MRTTRWTLIVALALTVFVSRAWSDVTHTARPGSINYVEGQAIIESLALNAASAGTVELSAGQTFTTQMGFSTAHLDGVSIRRCLFTGRRFFTVLILATGLRSFTARMDTVTERRAAASVVDA